MPETDLKKRILSAAVTQFCVNGFHGTSMRDIAREAQCSLPMMYYYFTNKNELYEEVAVKQFFALTTRLNSELDLSAHPADLYKQAVLQRRNLDAYDRSVIKIAYKLWYGFEGVAQYRDKIILWEKNRLENSRRMLDPYVADEAKRQVFAEVFTGFLESVIAKIVLLDEDIPEETVNKQLNFLLDLVK